MLEISGISFLVIVLKKSHLDMGSLYPVLEKEYEKSVFVALNNFT